MDPRTTELAAPAGRHAHVIKDFDEHCSGGTHGKILNGTSICNVMTTTLGLRFLPGEAEPVSMLRGDVYGDWGTLNEVTFPSSYISFKQVNNGWW
ncbi:hypothetical protein LTR66_015859 [Elasticomyces elasticus]|nr:hypothetical protein LTR66_015859 [Elasticomyces elasticus]